MRIAVCDDDRYDREQVLQALREAVRRTPPFDMVLLDIYLPGENGLETAQAVLSASPRTGLAFITASRDYAVDAFSLRALHYLVKPVTAEGVAETFRRLRELRPETRNHAAITVGRRGHRIPLEEICTLTSANHAVEITLADGRQLRVWTPLSELEAKLDQSFLKLNRGILVNMEFIEEMRSDRCVLRDGRELFLAVRDRGAICAAYQDYLLDRLSRRKKEAGL